MHVTISEIGNVLKHQWKSEAGIIFAVRMILTFVNMQDSAVHVRKMQLELKTTEGLLDAQRGVLSKMDDILVNLKGWEDPRLLEAKKRKNEVRIA